MAKKGGRKGADQVYQSFLLHLKKKNDATTKKDLKRLKEFKNSITPKSRNKTFKQLLKRSHAGQEKLKSEAKVSKNKQETP